MFHALNRILHKLRFARNKELSEVYISIMLRTLAVSMLGLFIPLYLFYELHYSLPQVIYFYLILSFVFGVFAPFATKISSKIGFKHSILLSIPFTILSFILLYSLESGFSFVYPAVVMGIADVMFWMGFHTDFANASDHKHRGEEVSNWFFLTTLVYIIGPIIGGFILSVSSMGFNGLFILSSVILFSSAIPLFFSSDKHLKYTFSFKHLFKKKYLKDFISFSSIGARYMISIVFWPIFVFLILGTYLSFGVLSSTVAFISALFNLYVGKLTKRFKLDSLIKLGAMLHSVTWFLRFIVKNISHVFLITTLGGLTRTLIDVPYLALVYDKAKKSRNVLEYLAFREMSLSFGKIFILLFVLVLFGILSQSFNLILAERYTLLVSFSIAGGAALLHSWFK